LLAFAAVDAENLGANLRAAQPAAAKGEETAAAVPWVDVIVALTDF
jgi:hypothetical protein